MMKSQSQRRVKVRGRFVKRRQYSAGVIRRIETAIEHTARRFHVSRSFVIAVACAEFFQIDEQERPDELRRMRSRS